MKMRVPDDLVRLFTGETGLAWFYSALERRYYSRRSGEVHSRIRGVNLPNPEALFQARCEANGVEMGSAAGEVYRPTSDVWNLWRDWKGRE